MAGQSPRGSLLASGTVIAALISGVTALVTALLPWLLPEKSPTTVEPAAIVATREAPSTAGAPNLAIGTWTIVSSVDDAGNDYAGSTLRFLTQHELGDRVEASGFFEWRLGQEAIGREQVVATYDPATRQLFIEGKYTDNPEVLAPGSFSAELSDDGRQLLNGRWGNVPGERVGILGTWEARR
ncbi:hypothetical protein [Lacipirellula limnantheis]|uniref:Uncharacterized protein n=1 Tax=Lacipirellula limnantheis TaxID=2528024 RepID=A0A517U4I2_9BACT|nr:hypothetical protein [Lacipirellula limnantheis]QDT75470.1 hypothetical protein I41_46810 [Lacipirellula limnantheis]